MNANVFEKTGFDRSEQFDSHLRVKGWPVLLMKIDDDP